MKTSWLVGKLCVLTLARRAHQTLDKKMTSQSNAENVSYAEWESFFDDAFSCAKVEERYSLPGDGREFAHVAWPLIEYSAKPVAQKITQLWQFGIIHPENIGSIYAAMLEQLWENVFSKVSRLVVLEFTAAQSTGLLDAGDGSDNYAMFNECLQDPEFSEAFLKRSPELCQLTTTVCQNWQAASLEFLEHLHADWDTLKHHFSNAPDDKITSIQSSLGDTHRHGRSVKIVEFSGGRKLVYKPRNLAVEVQYGRFISWFNTSAGDEMIRCVDVLNMESRGWCEHIDHLPVSDSDDLSDYFHRLGALMAVARVLGLTDLHSENLIAQGGWPIIIDLETLFHPLAGDLRPDDTQPPASNALRRTHDKSVSATGLLPVRKAMSHEHNSAINLAGMSDTAGQKTPFSVPMWHDAGSQKMRLVEEPQTLTGDANVPLLGDQRISPEPYLKQVLRGFRKAYAILEENQETLLSSTGPLADFGDNPIRIVIRATQTYLFLLADGSHPDLLESQEKKQTWFADGLKEADQSQILNTLRRSEMEALWRNDVPYFETTVDSRNVMACDGRLVKTLLPQTGLAITRQIITELGPEDLRRQCWLTEIALTKADHPKAYPLPTAKSLPFSKQPQIGVRDSALAVAHRAARDICEHAIVSDGHANWMTVQEGSGGTLTARLAGLDLYSGLPGIALFLSRAGHRLADPHIQTIAKAATCELLSALSLQRDTEMTVGGFSGTGGLFFALHVLAKEHPELECLEASRRILSNITTVGLSAASLELVDGLAGLLLGTGHIQSSGPLQRSICYEAINRLEQAIENEEPMHELFAAKGMAHGVEGLQFALTRSSQSDDHELKVLCAKGLGLLKELGSPAPKPEPGKIQQEPIAWCNGLTGNLLTNDIGEQEDRETITRELVARLEAQDYADHSLCHGAMGALQALQHVASSQPGCIADDINRLTGVVLNRLVEDGVRCGTINGVFSPGLMDGMAGIGMAALGIADQQPTSVIPLMAYCSLPLATNGAPRP